ncbi:MAG TPA: hypothetical protein VMJ32_00165 [Pirellulales bacterium]|nr:hypothetical protein [Pirellulales bacterium]
MKKSRSHLAISLAFSLAAATASAAQSWQGVQVMPKSAGVEILDDNGASVSMYDIAWPAAVQRTKGRFLWVQDEGGYSRNLAGGWIYADDVVKLDEAHSYYTNELRRSETAWLDWMCGISWENQNEPGIAAQYYQNVLTIDPNTRLDDVHIRLGRLLAGQQLLNGRGRYNPVQRDAWEQHFQMAQSINANRPQLYYEWGLALSQACACSQAKSLASQQAKLASNATADSAPEGIVDSNTDQANSPNQVALSPKQDANLKSAIPAASGGPAMAQRNLPSETIAAGVPAGPTAAGADAAVQSLAYYERAEQLDPRWWRIPLARAELMLNQCDQESADCPGERAIVPNAKPEFLTQLVTHCHRNAGREAGATQPLPDTDPSLAGANSRSAAAPTGETPVPTYVSGVLKIALDDFNRSISLNANALDAYRDRAEVLRLMQRYDEAEQSATTACKLCYYRQAGSLRTLAQINHDLQLNQPAADFALRAAELASGDEQQRYLQLWYKCSKQCSDETAKIAVASAQAGYVASRGGDEEDPAGNSQAQKPPAHIEPPPGFLSRAASAVPE